MSVALMMMMMPIAIFAQSKPRITSPSDRSTSTVGNQLNIYVSGSNIEVKYVGLNGSPNPTNTNESQNGFYTGFMYQSGSIFYFTPNTLTWENKWVKVVAHDKSSDLWSDPIYVMIVSKPQQAPTPPTQPAVTQTQVINADRWTNKNTTVYDSWNSSSRKSVSTLATGTQVHVSYKYVLSNGEQLAQIANGYVDANSLNTAAPAPTYTTQLVNADRWTNKATTVYDSWNPTIRKNLGNLSIGTQVHVSYKYVLSNGEQLAQIANGFVDATSLNTAAPAPTTAPQPINANRWINADNVIVYSDMNLTSQKTSLSKGTQVYVSYKYSLSSGKQVAQIQQGYVDANSLGTEQPPIQQPVNDYRWINADNVVVYSDLNLNNRINTSLNKGTKVYVNYKYTFSNGKQIAQINQGYLDANNLNTTDPNLGNSASVTKADYITILNYIMDYGTDLLYKIGNADYIKIDHSRSVKGIGLWIDGDANMLKSKLKLNNGPGYYDITTLQANSTFSNILKIKKICGIVSAISAGIDAAKIIAEYQETGDAGLLIVKGTKVIICCASAPACVFLETLLKPLVAGEIYQNYYAEKDFTIIGSAVKRKNPNTNIAGGYYIGDINATNGFKVTVDLCCVDRPLNICIVYASDARGGKLKVNGVVQNINFPSTNWSIGQQYVSGTNLKKGTNIIEFYGGYNTAYAPDIYNICVQDN